jgi:serine/threonine protein kinase
LLIEERYRLIKPLRQLDLRNHTDIFEVDERGTRKVMKVLKDDNPKLVELLEREATVLQWLNHPGIPKVEIDGYFTFTPSVSTQELHCLVMEFIEGENLDQWVKKHGAISQTLALNWLRQIVEILEQVHQHGFFHRDIKPSNIMLRPNGQLALIDFGAVREITNTYLAKISGGFAEGNGLELTGIISTGYTPLEQVNGRAVPQSDFYALGRTFVHLLTAKSIGDLPTNSETGKLIWRDKAPQISQPLADFIDDLMAPFPGERPQNAQIILQRLTASSMLIQSILRRFGSPKVRLRITMLLILGIIGLGLYRLSFPLLARYYLNRGLEAQKAERLDSARQNYELAIKFNPDNANAYNLLGLVCQGLKDFNCAENGYKQALKLNPNYATANYNLGSIYDDLGDYHRAAAQYEIAIRSDSYFAVDAINNLARVKILQRDNTTAVALALQGLQRTKDPLSKSALYKNLGWAKFQQGLYVEAQTQLLQALKLDSKMASAHCLLAQVLQVQGDKAGARAAWKDCLRYDSSLPEVKGWQSIAQPHLEATGEKR